MPRLTPDQFAKKWAANLGASGESIKRGIEGVTESPGAKAAAASDRWAAGVQAAFMSGKFADRVGSVSTEAWKQAAIKKGLPRISGGATEAIPLVAQFGAQLLPVTDRSKSECAAMSQGKGEAARARMNHNYDVMSAFKFQRR